MHFRCSSVAISRLNSTVVVVGLWEYAGPAASIHATTTPNTTAVRVRIIVDCAQWRVSGSYSAVGGRHCAVGSGVVHARVMTATCAVTTAYYRLGAAQS